MYVIPCCLHRRGFACFQGLVAQLVKLIGIHFHYESFLDGLLVIFVADMTSLLLLVSAELGVVVFKIWVVVLSLISV